MFLSHIRRMMNIAISMLRHKKNAHMPVSRRIRLWYVLYLFTILKCYYITIINLILYDLNNHEVLSLFSKKIMLILY